MIKGITGKNHYLDRLRRDVRRDWWLYAMLLPGLIYIIIFKYLPMYGVTIAFKNYSIFKGFEDSPWCGMDNLSSCLQGRIFGARWKTILSSALKN